MASAQMSPPRIIPAHHDFPICIFAHGQIFQTPFFNLKGLEQNDTCKTPEKLEKSQIAWRGPVCLQHHRKALTVRTGNGIDARN